MDRQFGRIMRSTLVARMSSSSFSLWEPQVDLYESENALIIFMEVAGIDPEKIKVIVELKTLIIRGERKCPVSGISCVHQLEIEYGHFERRIDLPKTIEVSATSSKIKKGMLRVHMPLYAVKQGRVDVYEAEREILGVTHGQHAELAVSKLAECFTVHPASAVAENMFHGVITQLRQRVDASSVVGHGVRIV